MFFDLLSALSILRECFRPLKAVEDFDSLKTNSDFEGVPPGVDMASGAYTALRSLLQTDSLDTQLLRMTRLSDKLAKSNQDNMVSTAVLILSIFPAPLQSFQHHFGGCGPSV